MHELGLADGIFDIVRQHVPVPKASRVRAVRVRIGDLAGVMPDSLDFCFTAIVAGTPYGAAFLEIERVAACGTCRECGGGFDMARLEFRCPVCGDWGITVASGEELQVVDIEVDDGVEVAS